jgi:hypothetical protein
MGGAHSKNSVSSAIKLMAEINVNIQQECSTINSLSNTLIVDPNPNCGKDSTYSHNRANFENTSTLNFTCEQAVKSSSTIQNTIKSVTAQLAKATTGAIGASSADATNITNNMTSLGSTISTDFDGKCTATNSGANDISLHACHVNNNTFNLANLATSTANCIQTAAASNSNANAITQIISQKAISKVEGLLGPLIGLLIAIAIIIGILAFAGENIVNSIIQMLPFLLAVFGLWLMLAAVTDKWPNNTANSQTTAVKAGTGTLGGVLFLLGLVTVVVTQIGRTKRQRQKPSIRVVGSDKPTGSSARGSSARGSGTRGSSARGSGTGGMNQHRMHRNWFSQQEQSQNSLPTSFAQVEKYWKRYLLALGLAAGSGVGVWQIVEAEQRISITGQPAYKVAQHAVHTVLPAQVNQYRASKGTTAADKNKAVTPWAPP